MNARPSDRTPATAQASRQTIEHPSCEPSRAPSRPTRFIPAAEALPALIEGLPADEDDRFCFTPSRRAGFLRRLADCGEVRAAAKASSVSHQTVYRLRRACPLFRRAWDAALLVAREHAEEALATRAMHGVEEEVFYHGEVVAKRRRYDSRLLLAHLARLDRLEARVDVAALAGEFDDLVEALVAGTRTRPRRWRSGRGVWAQDRVTRGPWRGRTVAPKPLLRRRARPPGEAAGRMRLRDAQRSARARRRAKRCRSWNGA